jgi:Flp pilus assembly protein TadD
MPAPLFVVLAVLTCLAAPAVQASQQGIERSSTLTLPDGSTIVLPPGTEGSEPMDHLPPAQPKAIDPSPSPPSRADKDAPAAGTPAERRKQRVNDLFARLAKAEDAREAEAISLMIDHLWLQSDSATADLLMSRAVAAMAAKDETTAAALLDKIIVLRPDWAEAWNKRATVRYLQDDDAGSMEDISHVLVLEPRHFGALSGMGFILHRNGDDKAALTVLRRAQAVDPQQPEVKALIDQLTPDVEGHEL